jgi:hypothetical protein
MWGGNVIKLTHILDFSILSVLDKNTICKPGSQLSQEDSDYLRLMDITERISHSYLMMEAEPSFCNVVISSKNKIMGRAQNMSL